MRSFVLGLLCYTLVAEEFTTQAHAVTLIDDLRTLRVEASGDSDLGGEQLQREYFPYESSDNPFEAWAASDSFNVTGAQSAVASVTGSFTSEAVTESRFAASGSVSGTATIFDETGYSAAAGGASVMKVTFEIVDETTWLLVAELAANGGAASVSIREGLGPAGALLHEFTHATHPTINQLMTLAPGQYTATFEAAINASIFGPPSLFQSGSFSAAMTVVPEPASVVTACIGLIALVAARVRRAPPAARTHSRGDHHCQLAMQHAV